MRHIYTALFVLVFANTLSAFTGASLAEPPELDHPLIEAGFEIPNHKAAGDRLKAHIERLAARAGALKTGTDTSDLDTALGDIFLPDNAQAFERTYDDELAVAQAGYKLDAWEKLADHYLEQGQLDKSKAASYRIYINTAHKERRAAALSRMAEAYLAEGDKKTALNLYFRSLQIHDVSNTRYRFRRLAEETDLTVQDVIVEVEKVVPSACVVFSQELKKPLPLKPEDYVRIDPGTDVDTYAQGNRICLRGLSHGGRYTLTVRAGVPSAAGPSLQKDVVRTFTVQNMAARISFDANSYVLAKSSDETIPIKTVNHDEVALTLYQIHDRNLVHAVMGGLIDDSLSRGEQSEIENTSGTKIWDGTLAVEGTQNREAVTLIPLSEMLDQREPGIYALTARKNDEQNRSYWRGEATQWVLVSDIGLTAYSGSEGLDVVVRSLATAEAKGGVTLTLIARNNKILGTTRSFSQGVASFAPGLIRGEGGDSPALVTATTRSGDYNFLKLWGPNLDLSERGVEGRYVSEALDAYLYTERGVYRPGEKVELSSLLRDVKTKAVGDVPLTFAVFTPSGIELKRSTITGDALGGYHLTTELSPAARAGWWRVVAFVDDVDKPVGEASFQVEDFVPQRITAKLASEQESVSPGDNLTMTLQGDFLYGAPAAGLKGEVDIEIVKDYEPFKEYRNYQFGLAQDTFYPDDLATREILTNAEGKAEITVPLNQLPDTSHPIKARAVASLFDVSGRPVYAGLETPIRTREVEVGLRRNANASFGKGEEAAFDLVALKQDGSASPGRKIRYEWIKEQYDYSWYNSGGRWQTRQTVYDEIIEVGIVEVDEKGEAIVQRRMDDGRYRLAIADTSGTSAASQQFYVGWWSASKSPNVPDALELTLEDDDVKAGDKLKAFVKAPFAGNAFVTIIGDKLLSSRTISIPEEGQEITIPVKAEWGPGAYLAVTAYRPKLSTPSRLPARAMALKWFSIDKDKRTLAVSFDPPKSVLPRQSLTLPLKVTGAQSKRQMKMTIAAVDEGILQLTNYQSPDPAARYLSQRALGVELRDIYGRLITPEEGARGQLRSGGGLAEIMVTAGKRSSADENQQGITRRTTKTVALYTRDVTVNDKGEGEVTLDLPDFTGRLRLMAVAYGESAMGSGEAPLVVRDPLVADLLLPRFMAPGDQASAVVSLHNVAGLVSALEFEVATLNGVVRSASAKQSIDLPKDTRQEIIVPLKADAIGADKITLRVTAEGMRPIERVWDIEVRSAQPFVTERTMQIVAPGSQVALSNNLLAAFLPGTARANITLATRPDFDVPGLLDDLDRYPYGCTEQTVSRALPMLYFADVAQAWSQDVDELSTARRVNHAIARILDRQRYDGTFGAWSANAKSHKWLSAYAVDFLTRAQEKDYVVSEAAFEHAVAGLKSYVSRPRKGQGYARAYAYYVLARLGEVKASDVRYYAERHGGAIETRLGLAHLGAALAILGERGRAEEYFAKAITKRRTAGKYYKDYGSDLRDAAAMTALIAETMNNPARVQALADILEKAFAENAYFSTQEKAWLLVATDVLKTLGGDLHVGIDDKNIGPQKKPVRLALTNDRLQQGFNVENKGAGPIRFVQSTRGVPQRSLPPVENGFSIKRTIYNADGELMDLSEVEQNDLMVVIIEGHSKTRQQHEALIVDLLPAGFEIENAALGSGAARESYSFLPGLSRTEFEAARDDRYVAAINVGPQGKFALAYIVRAVTPGTYVQPAIFIEDMYKPQYHARGSIGEVSVTK